MDNNCGEWVESMYVVSHGGRQVVKWGDSTRLPNTTCIVFSDSMARRDPSGVGLPEDYPNTPPSAFPHSIDQT